MVMRMRMRMRVWNNSVAHTIIERGEGLALMGWQLVSVNQKTIYRMRGDGTMIT